ncbi:serine/threonine-protein kinase WNK2-like [Helianthus annuus]|uniref:serine/threonine-protein kinase WNK2-like n=1 Tax=Helianthus annuus TaxID=4232 RepID=UPI001652D553|nr:serine/threonine-protein kinase WNK2-like [Helianthus annuus]
MDTSDTGDSDTTGPRPMESDEIMSSEHEVHTSDYTSTDDDDFQPFALPDGVDEPIVGGPAADLPLAPVEDPVDPADPFDPIDPDFDFDMAFVDPEPAVAPEQAAAFDPAHEHGLAHADVPVDPILAGQPLGDFPVDDIPLLDADHVVDPLVDPPIADVPVDPHVDHIDPVVAHIPSVIPPAGPGEGSSAHPFGHVPMPLPVISPVSASTSSFPVMPFGPVSEPSFWSSLPVMPPVDPPHMGHTLEDLLILMDTSDTGDSDTTGPRPMESDEIMSSEHEVHTSDYTSTDDDDFQPFALPDGVDEPIVGGPAADLPLAPVEDPVDPADPFDPIDPDFDFDMAFVDPEPAVAPEQAAAFDPAHEHGLAHADVPVDPILAGQPHGDFPADDIPLLDADHVVDPLVDPPIADVPVDPHVDLVDHVDAHVDPVLAPVDPLPIEPEHALFAEHMDPSDEEAQHASETSTVSEVNAL